MTTLPKLPIQKLMKQLAATRTVEIGCDECYDELDRFVELELNGKKPEEAMPLVQEHLNRCPDCREEFEVILAALGAVGRG